MATLNNIRLNGTTYQIGGSGSGGGGTGYYGVCTSYAETQAKTVTVDDSFSLVKGAVVNVVFDSQNTASSPTLNVNNTGAKPITGWGDSPATQADWGDYTLVSLVYTGTKWRMIVPADADADTKGLVKLSDTYSSNNTTAATPKAVNAALTAAKSYADSVAGSGGGTGGSTTPVWYGTCETAADTAAKVATVDSGFSLTKGATVCLRFSHANTDVTPTLNVNGTGAKTIVNAANISPVNEWGNGYYVHMVYNGTQWVMTTPSDADKTNKGIVNLANDYEATGDVMAASTIAVRNALTAAKNYADSVAGSGGTATQGTFYGTCTTGQSTTEKAATVGDGFTLKEGVMVAIKFTYQNSASVTAPTLNVNSTGAKPIVNSLDSAPAREAWGAGHTVPFVYDGTSWKMLVPPRATSTVQGSVTLGGDYKNNPTSTTAATTKAVADALADAKAYATPTIVNSDGSITASDIYDLADGEYWFAKPFEQSSYAVGTNITATFNTLLVGYVLCKSHVMYCQATGYSVKFVEGSTTTSDHAESGEAISKLPPLPVVTVLDSGKVLTVDSSGKWGAATPTGGGTQNVFYGTCSTAASTTEKVVTVSDDSFSLTAGVTVNVNFDKANSVERPTLNVNGTGAKNIRRNKSDLNMNGAWFDEAIVQLVYNGTYWMMTNYNDAGESYLGVVRLSNATDSTAKSGVAATPNAVKLALDAAKTYADELIGGIENGTY